MWDTQRNDLSLVISVENKYLIYMAARELTFKKGVLAKVVRAAELNPFQVTHCCGAPHFTFEIPND